MRLYPVIRSLRPRHAFRIARGAKGRVDNLFVAVEQDGVVGYGEAAPNAYYGEYAADGWEALMGATDLCRRSGLRTWRDVSRLWKAFAVRLAGSLSARCALDLALWDLAGKLHGRSVASIVWGHAPASLQSATTLGISSDKELEAKLAELKGAPIIKIKAGARPDWELLARIRRQIGCRLWVDANASWSGLEPSDTVPALRHAGVELLEQPLPPSRDEDSRDWKRLSGLAVIADESCVGPGDVRRVRGAFSGINVKLSKCGGLTPALKMLREARRRGLQVMAGCMLETSLGIAAGGVLAQGADYVDLDGAWLLAEDPFEGPVLEKGRLRLQDAPGLGVCLRNGPETL